MKLFKRKTKDIVVNINQEQIKKLQEGLESPVGPTRAKTLLDEKPIGRRDIDTWVGRIANKLGDTAKVAEQPLARRDERYRTILLKELVLELCPSTQRESLEKRLNNVETALYSQPLPTFDTTAEGANTQ